MKFRAYFAGAAAASAMLLASPGWAGQAGSVDTTVIATVDNNSSSTIIGSDGSITKTSDAGGSTDDTAVNLDSSLVTLSLQVIDEGYHGYSPTDNVATFEGDTTNLIGSFDANAGIATTSQTVGVGSVSVSSNTFVDMDALGVLSAGTTSPTPFAAATAFILSPTFTTSNSKVAAQALALMAFGDAIATSTAAGADWTAALAVVALEFKGAETYEMSPHDNVATFASIATNEITAFSGNLGISTAQQQVGVSNVQTSFNNIMWGTGAAAGAPLPGGF